jgi:hypothetical protein
MDEFIHDPCPSIISKKIESFFNLYSIYHQSVIRSHAMVRRDADAKRIKSGVKLLYVEMPA